MLKEDTAAAAKGRVHASAAPALITLPNAGGVIEAVTALTRELVVASSLRGLLSAALRAVARLVPTQHASVFVTGEDDGSMVRAAQPHDELGKAIQGELDVTRIHDARVGIVGRVIAMSEPARVQDTAADPDFDRTVDCAPGYVIRSALCAPVCGTQGKVLAAVLLCNKTADTARKPQAASQPPSQPPGAQAAESDERAGSSEEFTELDQSALIMFATLLAPALERQLLKDGFEG